MKPRFEKRRAMRARSVALTAKRRLLGHHDVFVRWEARGRHGPLKIYEAVGCRLAYDTTTAKMITDLVFSVALNMDTITITDLLVRLSQRAPIFANVPDRKGGEK